MQDIRATLRRYARRWPLELRSYRLQEYLYSAASLIRLWARGEEQAGLAGMMAALISRKLTRLYHGVKLQTDQLEANNHGRRNPGLHVVMQKICTLQQHYFRVQ